MYQCFLYMRDPNDPSNEDSNYYTFPLAISPVVDTVTRKVIRIDLLPTGADHKPKKTQPLRVPPGNEYTPEHQDLRSDLKPLNVVQPEGASFKVTHSGETGQSIEWQKWSFRVGFNQREGMVLYDVRLIPMSVLLCILIAAGAICRAEFVLPSRTLRHEYSIRRSSTAIPQESSFRSGRCRRWHHG